MRFFFVIYLIAAVQEGLRRVRREHPDGLLPVRHWLSRWYNRRNCLGRLWMNRVRVLFAFPQFTANNTYCHHCTVTSNHFCNNFNYVLLYPFVHIGFKLTNKYHFFFINIQVSYDTRL